MHVVRGGLWGKPETDLAVRRAAFETEVKLAVVRARSAAKGPKADSLYDATSAAAKRKPLASAMRFVDDLVEARTPLPELEAFALLLWQYAKHRYADVNTKAA